MKNPLLSTLLGGAALAGLSACSVADGNTSQAEMARSQSTDIASAQDTGFANASATPLAGGNMAGPELAETNKPELIKASAMSAPKSGDKQASQKSATGTAASFPDPKTDVPTSGGTQVAVLAGGCFWTQEAVFEHVKGVKSVVSGYAGGSAETATYEQVGTRKTGHAESVRITFDPSQISYGHLLKIFFAASHDPTQVNRQGPDTGSDYRSAIFPQNAQQRKVAESYMTQLGKANVYDKPIATKIESGKFYPAEDHHQNFVQRNPRHPYVLAYDVAKLNKLNKAFPGDWRNGTSS